MTVGRFGELVPTGGFSRMGRQLDKMQMSGWRSHDGIAVVSGCHTAPLPGTDGTLGPQWKVSVSRLDRLDRRGTTGERATDDDLRRVIDAFAMPAWDEDNHHPGVARHLWCPHDETARLACECHLSETTIVDVDGYRWTNDESKPCRGCEYEQLVGTPCPLHGTPARQP